MGKRGSGNEELDRTPADMLSTRAEAEDPYQLCDSGIFGAAGCHTLSCGE
ncbi:hypothetical protein [Micromonospora fulviviridis]